MNSESFVRAVEQHIVNAAIEDMLEELKQPTGRRVPPEIQARTDWYNGLPAEARDEHVGSPMADSGHG